MCVCVCVDECFFSTQRCPLLQRRSVFFFSAEIHTRRRRRTDGACAQRWMHTRTHGPSAGEEHVCTPTVLHTHALLQRLQRGGRICSCVEREIEREGGRVCVSVWMCSVSAQAMAMQHRCADSGRRDTLSIVMSIEMSIVMSIVMSPKWSFFAMCGYAEIRSFSGADTCACRDTDRAGGLHTHTHTGS